MNLGLLCVVVRVNQVLHWLVYLNTSFQVGSTIWEGYRNFGGEALLEKVSHKETGLRSYSFAHFLFYVCFLCG